MIRFSKSEDFLNIRKLWDLSFPGDAAFADWFFPKLFKNENTLVYEINGEVCSVLQRLPYYLNNVGDVTYIFGACTHPSFRGRGLMAKLLEFSESIDREQGKMASILIPAEKSLFDYYMRFGYEPVFKISKKEFSYEKPKDFTSKYEFKKCSSDDATGLEGLYNKVLRDCNYVYRTREYFCVQLSMFIDLGGRAFSLYENAELVAYAFVWSNASTIASELLFKDDESRLIICNEILKYFNVDRLEAFYFSESDAGQDFGCIKLYQPFANHLPFKMNLMFN